MILNDHVFLHISVSDFVESDPGIIPQIYRNIQRIHHETTEYPRLFRQAHVVSKVCLLKEPL